MNLAPASGSPLGHKTAVITSEEIELSNALENVKKMGDMQALARLERWAAQGNPKAQYHLGKIYESGQGVARDPEKAKQYLEQCTKTHNLPDAPNKYIAPAHNDLGCLYSKQGLDGTALNHFGEARKLNCRFGTCNAEWADTFFRQSKSMKPISYCPEDVESGELSVSKSNDLAVLYNHLADYLVKNNSESADVNKGGYSHGYLQTGKVYPGVDNRLKAAAYCRTQAGVALGNEEAKKELAAIKKEIESKIL